MSGASCRRNSTNVVKLRLLVALAITAVATAAAVGPRPAIQGMLAVSVVGLATVDGPSDDLQRAIEAVERLSDGEYDVSVAAAGDDDAARLADAVDDLSSTLRERELEERESEEYRRKLARITADTSIDDETKIRRLLELGCDRLDVEGGFVSRIDESTGRYEIRTAHGSDFVSEGAEMNLSDVYCRNTVESDDILGVYDASTTDETVAEHWDVGCYLGGKLTVEGELYGTLCFVDREPREEPFAPAEKAFVDILVRWMSYVFETRERERRLERHHAHTEEVLDAVDDLFYILEEDGTLRKWNRALNEVTGYTDAELASMHSLEFFDEPYVDQIASAIETVFEQGRVRTEAPLLTKDGDEIPYEFVASALEDRDGNRILVGIGRDITERKEKERQLRERERDLERRKEYTDKILDAVDDVFYVVNEDCTLQRWNESLCEVTGYSDEEIESLDVREFFVEDDRDAITRAIERIDEVAGQYLEATVLTSDGERIPFELVATPLEEPEGGRVVAGIARDITERKKREREFRETNERLGAIVSASPAALVASNLEGEVDLWNPAAERIFGWSPEEVRGERLPIVPVDRVDEFEELRERVVAGEIVTGFETRRKTKSGSRVDVNISAAPLRNSDGEVTGVVAAVEDISERKNQERELRRTQNMLQQSQHLARVGAWELDVRGDDPELTFTDEVYRIHDLPVGEELGLEEAIEFYHPEDRQQVREAVEGAIERGEEYDIESRLITRKGTERWVRSIGEPVREDGEITRIRGSIQNITDQKERELALRSLHDVARDLLNTETESEVAELVVDAAEDVLDVDGVAVYLLDPEESRLTPAAFTDGFVDVRGEAAPIAAGDADSTVWNTFVTRTQTMFGDAVAAATRSTADNGLLVPLGDHGVFAAVADSTAIDDETRRLVETLAATTEAAFDRLESEAALRERDAELREQNRRLRRQIGINEIIRSIDRTLIQADSQEAIEETVCERLVDAQDIAIAWIGGFDAGRDELVPRAWAGTTPEYLNTVSLHRDDQRPEPSVVAAVSGDSTAVGSVVERLKDEKWRKQALTAGLHSVISVPLSVEEYDFGVLSVYADEPNAFGDLERAVFEELGRNIANSINAVRTRLALHSDTVLELTLRLDAPDEFLSRIARETGTRVEYEGLGEHSPDQTQVFFETTGDLEAVEALLDDLVSVREYRLIRETNDRCRFEATVAGDVLASKLVRRGGRPRSIRADGTELEVVVDVAPTTSVREFVEGLEDSYPSVELVARHDVERVLQTRRYVVTSLFEGLTERQLEVLRTAYFAGFFDWPRENTGEDVAEMLDVSQPTVNRHLRVGQQQILSELFEKESGAVNE